MKYKGKKVQNWIHGMALELRDKKKKKKKKRSQKEIELNKKLSRGEDHE